MIALLLPVLPLLLAGVAALGGIAANWWLELTDWQSTAIFIGALIVCATIAQAQSPWSRLAITAVIAGGLYLKGHVDGNKLATAKHEVLREAEAKRQQEANTASQLDAMTKLNDLYLALKASDDEVGRLKHEATQDRDAHRVSLGIDSIRRLNRLRGD